jgi:hypothetical protein
VKKDGMTWGWTSWIETEMSRPQQYPTRAPVSKARNNKTFAVVAYYLLYEHSEEMRLAI